jgi:hypothetical protein
MPKLTIAVDRAAAEAWLPSAKPDFSGVGVNYADAFLKPFKLTLEDGRKLLCKRRGIKLTFTIGERTGEALLRRLAHGPDVLQILRKAMQEAAAQAGVGIAFVDAGVELDVPDLGSTASG